MTMRRAGRAPAVFVFDLADPAERIRPCRGADRAVVRYPSLSKLNDSFTRFPYHHRTSAFSSSSAQPRRCGAIRSPQVEAEVAAWFDAKHLRSGKGRRAPIGPTLTNIPLPWQLLRDKPVSRERGGMLLTCAVR